MNKREGNGKEAKRPSNAETTEGGFFGEEGGEVQL